MAKRVTGLRTDSLLASCETVLSLISNFWSPKSIEIDVARCRLGLLWGMDLFPTQNTMSRGLIARVLRSPSPTKVYSQLRIAKNSAPQTNHALASSRGRVAIDSLCLKTIGGIAFSCCVAGSFLL